MMKLAVYSLSLKDKTPEKVSELALDHGCDGIEWWCREGGHMDRDNLVSSAEKISGIMKNSGLETAGLSPYFNCEENSGDVSRICEAASIIGARIIRCHGLKFSPGDRVSRVAEKQKKWLGETVLPVLEKHGRKMVLEQHHNTILPTPEACRNLVEGFPPEHFGIIYDPGNSLFEGYTAPRYAVNVLGEYLSHVHAKSAKPAGGEGSVPQGRNYPMSWGKLSEGDLDWEEILKELSRQEYSGYISLEALDGRESGIKMNDDMPYLRLLIDKTAAAEGEEP